MASALFLFFLLTVSAQAATVRGRLENRNRYPASYVAVTLYNDQVGRSATAYTGGDGMYYLYNVPPGDYLLEVWLYPNRPPLTYSIRVHDPGTDIPPILLP
jgi:hypothetical protein